MNPQGSAWAQTLTSAAFVYYLSMTPAAALVNLTQTTVVGVPIMGAYWGKGGQARAAKELAKASSDFLRGRGNAGDSDSMTRDEKRAMQAAL
ncbi:MAG: PLxRFG domain-containing protein [Thalassovita sp.]